MIQEREKNYNQARNEIIKLIGQQLTHKNIQKINSLIMGANSLSSYRNEVGAYPICRDGVKVYLPASGVYVEKEIQKLLDWYNMAQNKFSPDIIAARLHWGLVKIHPFVNGNGRTARLFSILVLLNHNYENEKLLKLEQYFEDNKYDYYEKNDDGIKMYNGFEKVSPEWEKYFLKSMQEIGLVPLNRINHK